MPYTLTKGVQSDSPKKLLIYGPEGIGKTTFVAGLLSLRSGRLIDAEDGSKQIDTVRYPVPDSWSALLDMVRDAAESKDCSALAIDTMDAAERLCMDFVLQKNGWASLENPGYGAGYKILWEQYQKLIKALDQCVAQGKDVFLTAHAVMRKFEQPDQMGSYDRWELKLQNSPKCSIAALVKEWTDAILFANYKTTVVTGSDGKTKKATGGKRVIYTTHHPCWDAKNRFGMPEELDMDYTALSPLWETSQGALVEQQAADRREVDPKSAEFKAAQNNFPVDLLIKGKNKKKKAEQKESDDWAQVEQKEVQGLPDSLGLLMIKDKVHPIELETWTERKEYFPAGTKLKDYDPDYLAEFLPAHWEEITREIMEERTQLPF